MQRQLVLEDSSGNIIRTFGWDGLPLEVVRRADTRRLELVPSVTVLKKHRIRFQHLGSVSMESLAASMELGVDARLRLVPQVENTIRDERAASERARHWYLILAVVLLFGGLGAFVLTSEPPKAQDSEAALKQEVIRIVKRIPPRQKPAATVANSQEQTQTKPTEQPKSMDRIKRMGALAALGSLSKGRKVAGVDLNAAQTTAGPGLGGTQGSGGVQTSLYAKGLTSAPIGVGGRIEGAGGYGTKGKGGGQAGYGKMTLVGSTGAAPVGLADEAVVESGLDRDQIAAVIQQHLGEVRFCYEQGLQADPNLSGRVAVGFTIGGQGSVKVASVENSSLGSKIIEDCIVMRLKSWKFPEPRAGVDVKVSYPFVLRRAGQV
jgi:outer membrane biosynthesis protein TonB